jgi:hypothetical protein
MVKIELPLTSRLDCATDGGRGSLVCALFRVDREEMSEAKTRTRNPTPNKTMLERQWYSRTRDMPDRTRFPDIKYRDFCQEWKWFAGIGS